ncbi:phosphoribosylglycinamide formyltransferase [Halarcobacter bivalviorum]|uniref:Phosphoribosylglycinamide formyltransferase n=1 Tax=Halarcobacter bivalviorum TaxID=663364 RepID=A0AAX2A682_9BACT|nr:phosphoribosylglycinamide formyltransferase [Halarcobacter bivalviorum]AXH13626.1 phosphoribosylglycinamide formyltransferase 1 [Halarcobacter bivalviorum]RXK09769.1 phosphoribosylglycinamide formyltransferase [Halarcobacter bivalviorum]
MKRIGILSSHNGSGFDAIQKACEEKILDAQVVLVVSNNSTAKVLEKAESKNIPNFIINDKKYPNENLDKKITELMQEFKIDYIFLSGYMKKIEENLVKAFEDKIINSHPALLPKFGGKGMYGTNVHKAVIEAGEKESGCTVHFVNENYDEGKFILQAQVEVDKNETVESLEEKIKNLETKTIIEALKIIIN